MDEELRPNSHKYKQEAREDKAKADISKKRVEKPIVKANAVHVRKKGELSKIKSMLGSTDIPNIKSYIVTGILIPAFFNAISDTVRAFTDAVNDGTDIILFGKEGRRKKKNRRVAVERESYRDYYEKGDRFERRDRDRFVRRFDLDDLVFDSKSEAELVLDHMGDMIETYGVVTVNELYDMVDLTAPYTAASYGWTNLSNVGVERLREGGYIINLPRPKPID